MCCCLYYSLLLLFPYLLWYCYCCVVVASLVCNNCNSQRRSKWTGGSWLYSSGDNQRKEQGPAVVDWQQWQQPGSQQARGCAGGSAATWRRSSSWRGPGRYCCWHSSGNTRSMRQQSTKRKASAVEAPEETKRMVACWSLKWTLKTVRGGDWIWM